VDSSPKWQKPLLPCHYDVSLDNTNPDLEYLTERIQDITIYLQSWQLSGSMILVMLMLPQLNQIPWILHQWDSLVGEIGWREEEVTTGNLLKYPRSTSDSEVDQERWWALGQVINVSMDYFDHRSWTISPLASLRERPSSDESSFALLSMICFHSFADNLRLVRNVLTVAPWATTSTHQGHSQMRPYARVATDRREMGIGDAERKCRSKPSMLVRLVCLAFDMIVMDTISYMLLVK